MPWAAAIPLLKTLGTAAVSGLAAGVSGGISGRVGSAIAGNKADPSYGYGGVANLMQGNQAAFATQAEADRRSYDSGEAVRSIDRQTDSQLRVIREQGRVQAELMRQQAQINLWSGAIQDAQGWASFVRENEYMRAHGESRPIAQQGVESLQDNAKYLWDLTKRNWSSQWNSLRDTVTRGARGAGLLLGGSNY